jgi:UDP-glucose:(heptosyl)LPS alpha-1,3-glucosyltransferase
MNLALVFPGCHRRGGVERIVYEAARYFARNHQVTVYAQEFEEAGLDGVTKRLIPRRGPRALRLVTFSREAKRALDAGEHDHVISFGVSRVGADILWVSSVHAAWLEHREAVPGDRLRSHPMRRYLLRHQIILAMERQYFTEAGDALAITVSDRVADDLARLYGFPRGRSVVVHNGFDPGEFGAGPAATARAETRRNLGLPDDAVVLLLVANELSRKGLAVLLDAVAELSDERVHVLLVGRASPAPYRRRVQRLKLTDRFHYAGSTDRMSAIHGAADLFVLPTRYEAFCLAVVEALASGLPVITTDVPGAHDLVLDGVNGRLQRDPADHTELAALLREALTDERLKLWAANAPASVADHTWAKLFDRALGAIATRDSLATRA